MSEPVEVPPSQPLRSHDEVLCQLWLTEIVVGLVLDEQASVSDRKKHLIACQFQKLSKLLERPG